MIVSVRAARAVFPPEQVAEVKALACQLPATHGLPLGRFSRSELHRLVIERGLSDASASTIWRWLHDDALKPWQQSLDVVLVGVAVVDLCCELRIGAEASNHSPCAPPDLRTPGARMITVSSMLAVVLIIVSDADSDASPTSRGNGHECSFTLDQSVPLHEIP
jgi:hypothetical protein